jgi:hypothetical protein
MITDVSLHVGSTLVPDTHYTITDNTITVSKDHFNCKVDNFLTFYYKREKQGRYDKILGKNIYKPSKHKRIR